MTECKVSMYKHRQSVKQKASFFFLNLDVKIFPEALFVSWNRAKSMQSMPF